MFSKVEAMSTAKVPLEERIVWNRNPELALGVFHWKNHVTIYRNFSHMSTHKPKIVILGAGFGGVYTFLHLRKFLGQSQAEITIINKTNHFLFTPLLHEVATGGLAHHQVVESIREITYKKGATIHVAEIKHINTAHKTVETDIGPVPYDYLVIATGAVTEFYGIPGAAEKTYVLKTLRDAIGIRNKIIDAFEKAVEIKDISERRKLLSFVLVGGGATGVELAAEVSEFFHDAFQKFLCGKISAEDVSIHLIAGEPNLLNVFKPGMQKRARMILERVGVKVHTGKRVIGVEDTGVILSDNSKIESRLVIWVAGVKPNTPASDVPLSTSASRGRIVVQKTMKVVGQEHVYALGDVATFEGQFLPTHAQVAVQEAPVVAHNIVGQIRNWRTVKEFRYNPIGDLVSLGRWQASGHILGILWTGPLAWFIWRTVYLFKYASWSKRIKIAVDWTVDIFYPRDITRA